MSKAETRPRIVAVFGGAEKRDQIKKLEKRGADMIIATPGRLLDFASSDPSKRHQAIQVH